jgi:transcriptional regulator
MKYKHLLLFTILWSGALTAVAQSDSIVGTWALTAANKLLPDGTRVHDHFGDNPHGIALFPADGHYTVEIYRADHTKFSSGDRLKGTPDEYKEALDGMSVHFGRYTVDSSKHTITFIIDRASFSDWGVLEPQHGWGIARRFEQISGDLLAVNQGTLYPLLLKLEHEGSIASEWGATENNRRARFYRLTATGRKQLQAEARDWKQTAAIIARFFNVKAEDLV